MNHSSNSAAIDFSEFRTSWRVLILALLGIGISINSSLLYGFGTLVVPLEEAFGWSRSALQVAITFLFVGAVISLQLVGWFNLRFGIKKVTAISTCLTVLGYLAATQLGESIWSLYLAFTIIPILSIGNLAVTWTQLLNMWFEKNRGLALAIGLSGTGLAAATVPPLLSWGIGIWGWQAAFIMLAMINLLLLLPLTIWWFSVPKPKSHKSEADKQAALRSITGMTFKEGFTSKNFWICNIALALVMSVVIGMVTNTIPILRDLGLSAEEAGLVFSGFGISLVFGRILVGYLLDRVWAPGISAISLAMPAIGCLILLSGTTDFTLLLLAAIAIGFGAGAEFDIAAFLVARYFGLKEYGRLYGFHIGLLTATAAAAPLLFAAFLSQTGSYTTMLVYCLVCSIVGPLMLLTLGRAPQFETQPPLKPAVA
ncbi:MULTISPECIES: MFS transporter [Halopseudomonas]|uniref:MFS transporter n=1 Tax=Halopseudomonas bauzanensis TaxID=653930 RepID=A0A1H9U4Z2_9GAMM|nr:MULTISPECIES: MFS transporter [Halopseudomonas]TKA89672.1 MFS transporter [Halopseudomonas bauzanensis]SES04506.1 Predicted arabinose efflux permease, MFS family [Halopseudomonas bauzanensis]SFM05212.1 Predicted arabinose efflux permease, MFS family [Halopseudomonas bauzanensis]